MNTVVILPTFNEKENILTMLEGVSAAWLQIPHHKLTILVVDDQSPDGTGDLVRAYQKKHANVTLISKKKEGLGSALLFGMNYALDTLKAEVIVQMDADLSHDPVALPLFMAAISKGADFAVGSRYIPGGSIPDNWGLHRKLFSIMGNAIVRFGLGYTAVHDWTGGYRAYLRSFAAAARGELSSYQGYVFQIAYLHKSVRRGAKITEVPIHFTDRKFGHSKIAPSQYIRDVLRYVIGARVKATLSGSFGKFLVVGSVGFIINTTILEIVVRLGFHPALGSGVGAELAIVSNFFLNNGWTFGSRRVKGIRAIGKFFQFNMTSAGAILIQAGTVWTGTMLFGVSFYRWFYLLGVGIGLVWNYTMYSKVIWKK
ncbi:glycosyltransferase family 2 protein [Candidatus Gottesmanbacteria bacterium]|nr:glycosyltransferase family 2 protein [Candidatus Gottesmanbacteria bacterium]